MNPVEFNTVLNKTRSVANGGHEEWLKLNQLERITVALVLNNPTWIMEIGLSMAQAIEYLGPERCAMLLAVEQALSLEITRKT